MRKLSLALVGMLALPFALDAQAGPTPSFQPTRVAVREYNFALADFDGGSALLFQWREGLGNPRSQFTADVGFADLDGQVDDGALIIGGSFHYQIMNATTDLPFDMVLGAGLGITTANNYSVLRIPVGVAIGHRFPLEGNFAITPFVHPRLSINRSSVDTPLGDINDTESDIEVDLGASFEINSQMQARLAITFGNSESVGLGFAWMPRGLR
jgi:hypothetical protein